MRIEATNSYFGALEYLVVRKPKVWGEIAEAIGNTNWATVATRAQAGGGTVPRRVVAALGNAVEEEFLRYGWANAGNGVEHCRSGDRQVRKDRVLIETFFGERPGIAGDFWRRCLGLYADDLIDVAVAAAPIRALQSRIGPDCACYEDEQRSLVSHERRPPAVPLLLVGVAP